MKDKQVIILVSIHTKSIQREEDWNNIALLTLMAKGLIKQQNKNPVLYSLTSKGRKLCDIILSLVDLED